MQNIMTTAKPKIFKQKWAQLLSDHSGLALTEFALSLPIMMMMSITFVELASFINANMRVSQIALSVADNTGRIRQSIDVTDVDAAMIGARIAGDSIKFGENGRVILSMVEVNGKTGTNAGQKITWQRCFGANSVTSSFGAEGAGKDDAAFAAGFGPTSNKIQAATGDGLMFVEVVYDYQTIFPVGDALLGGLGGRTISATAAYPVRERSNNALQNGFGLAANAPQQRLCSNFTAT
jgi:hypothetical protein